MSQRTLGVIPARGGSKGIPRKNVREVAGKPLIAWTADQVDGSTELDRVIVSTDDEEIADIAREHGLDVPFLRPDRLARDTTAMEPTIAHAAERMADAEGFEADYVVCLQPTSPLRTGQDIDDAVRLAREESADAVVSLTPTKQHPYWMKRVTDEGRVESFLDLDREYKRRQDLPPAYMLNGAVFLSRPDLLAETGSWYAGDTYAYVMPEERSLDVDSPLDLRIAEMLLEDGTEVDET